MLSNRIKFEREKRKLSQLELSKHIGVSQQTVGSWEVGRTEPDSETIIKIADFFHVTTDYLLGRDEAEGDSSEHSTFSERIKHLRAKNNVSLEDIARYVGVSADTYHSYELGEIFPDSIIEITKIANYFNVSLDYLMCRSRNSELLLNPSLLEKYFDGYSDIGENIILVRENNKNFVIMSFEKYLLLKDTKKADK